MESVKDSQTLCI